MSRRAETEGYITLTSSSEEESDSPSPPPAKRTRAAAAAAAPSRRQPPRRGLAGRSREGSPVREPGAGPAAAAGLRRSCRQAAGQEQRAGQAAALTHLRQARAAAATQRGGARQRRRTAAVIEDDDEEDEERGAAGRALGSDGDGSDGQPPSSLSPTVRRRRRGGKPQNKFLTGARDYVQSESEDDLGNFIADDHEDDSDEDDSDAGSSGSAASDSGGSEQRKAAAPSTAGRSSRGQRGQQAAADACGRRAAAAARGWTGAGLRVAAAAQDWEDDGDSEGGHAHTGAAGGHGGSSSDGAEADGRGRQRKRRAAAVVASSESEDELPAGAKAAAAAATPAAKRRRLQRPGAAGATPGSSGRQKEQQQQQPEAGDAVQSTPGTAEQPPPQPEGTPGGSAQRPRRQLPAHPALTAADRIRLAQRRWQLAPGLGSAAGGGEEEEEEGDAPLEVPGTDDDVSVLTDEGDPDAQLSEEEGQQSSQGGAGEVGKGRGRQRGRQARGGGSGHERSRGASPGWQRAADVLGLVSYTLEQLFSIYVEFQLLCYVDPGYAETVRASPRHDEYYQRAIRSVEFEMTRVRGSVASDAWRSSTSGLLQAVECLPGIETGWTDEDGAQELAGRACDACNRSRAHATRELILKGVPYQPLWGDAALISNRRLSDQYAHTSPVFQKRQRLEWLEGEPRLAEGSPAGDCSGGARPASRPAAAEQRQAQAGGGGYRRERFHVGRFCCARLTLYHALFHWRRRLLARLKRELKAELRRRRRGGFPCDRSAVADALLGKQSLMAELYANCRRLLALAERYQLSGGEGSRGGWKSEFEGMQAEVAAAQAELHDDSEADEPSVAWPDEAEGGVDGEEADSGGEAGSASSCGQEEEEEEGEGEGEEELPGEGEEPQQARQEQQHASLQSPQQQQQQQPASAAGAAAEPQGAGAGSSDSRRTPQAGIVAASHQAQQQTPPSQRLRQIDIRQFFRRHPS